MTLSSCVHTRVAYRPRDPRIMRYGPVLKIVNATKANFLQGLNILNHLYGNKPVHKMSREFSIDNLFSRCYSYFTPSFRFGGIVP